VGARAHARRWLGPVRARQGQPAAWYPAWFARAAGVVGAPAERCGFSSEKCFARGLYAALAGQDAGRARVGGEETPVTTSGDVRRSLVDLLRRDLFGPHPERDRDLEREVLQDKPSRFYVGGFIVPAFDGITATAADEDEQAERIADDLLAAETFESPI